MLVVDLRKLAPLGGQVIECKDRGDRTNGHARATIDPLLWIDVSLWCVFKFALVLLRMDAIDWASIHACRILYADAGLGDRKEVGTKEARTLRCACGRTIVIQAGSVYGRDNLCSGSRRQPV